MSESVRTRRARALLVSQELKRLFPTASTQLRYSGSWELLVAVMLSAQCTDKKVNEVTEKLFEKYRKLEDYASAAPAEFERDIKPTGFYKSKTKHILRAARIIQERFEGKVPCSMEDLLKLPGVGRKTANVVLGFSCGIAEGIPVDTHVRRFALKLALTKHKDPVKIERDLMELFPAEEWLDITLRLIEYGRSICPARPHECSQHPLTRLYPEAAKIWPRAKS